MQQLTEHLIDLGYPPCEGNIMVSNPYWCKTADEYKTDITKWINSPDMKSYLDLAIFIDAFAVAGDKELLINLKEYLYNKIQSKDIFMAYFAKSTLAFDTPTTFSSFMAKDDLINIKKAAIFPIVQGIRSLALKEKIKETTTIKRIKILEDKKILEKILVVDEILDNIKDTQPKNYDFNKIDLIDEEKLNELKQKFLDKKHIFISTHKKLNIEELKVMIGRELES